MLTKLSSAISIAILAAGVTAVLDAAPASAGGGPGGRRGHIQIATSGRRPGHAPTGGGGGSGKAAPIPCPPDVACIVRDNGAAPPARIPTVDVAFEARDQLELPTPTVHTSPRNRTYVALRTGLWLDRGDYARETKTISTPDGATTVTAIGDPQEVKWNMGESTVTCHSPGSRNGKACGYTYDRSSAGQPNGRYAISATVTWYVSWTCQGVCDAPGGDWAPNSTMSRTTETTLAVGEVQTQSRPG